MKTVALIEDNPDNRLLVSAILDGKYEIVEYENGREGLSGIQESPPNLVLLDISLPEMDGMEVLRHIRADETIKSLPVIALTAHAMAGDRDKFIEYGFDDYVTKPILDDKAFLNLIQKWTTNASS